MKRALFVVLPALLLGGGCGDEPLTRVAEAEASGNLVDAAAQYKAICDKGSPLCPVMTTRIERFKLKEALKALDVGEYKKAKASLDAAAASSDASVKRAAEAMSKLPDLEKGLIWEEASASPALAEALGKIEVVAEAGVSASPKAKEWLAKNRPKLLLERAKAACTPTGEGSCADAVEALARLHPGSPEGAEAQKLVDVDYARVVPLLKDSENLLGQRVMIYDNDQKIDACLSHQALQSGTQDREACETQVIAEKVPTVPFLTGAFQKKLDAIHDPHYVKALETRFARAGTTGEFDREPWPKPAGQK